MWFTFYLLIIHLSLIATNPGDMKTIDISSFPTSADGKLVISDQPSQPGQTFSVGFISSSDVTPPRLLASR